MRQNSALGMIIAVVVLIAALAGGYVYLTKQQTNQPGDPSLEPTALPIPNVRVLEAATDIDANKLIGSDLEQYFNVVEVQPTEVTPDDVLETEFFSAIQGKVTTTSILGGERIKKSAFRNAGIAEKLPTPEPGAESPKAYNLFVSDIGGIVAEGNSVDIVGSYSLEQPYLRFTGVTEQGITLVDEKYLDISTHMLAQNVRVLKVVAPPLVSPDGQQTGAAPAPAQPTVEVVIDGTPVEQQPTPEPVFNQGSQWQIVVALTAQQVELLEYTKAKTGSTLNVVVRRADDQDDQIVTTGVTMDLLMRLYGVPQVYAQPNMIVKLLDAPAPPQPPQQPPVVIPFPLPNAPQQQPLPTAVPTQTP
ncbi:CpaB family protein [Herpetosiphon geysericola]|uniref:SAF domain-containing protein n=1 Tax=Herpetosiphon geysericola TaxID=70996 RepID=A0A0P6XZP0_9CHLR|nr:hypothetical protein [Herpetosiphon geysericola]KPL85301.1 hypothetical protein SE18_16630 [Herpetosiphon geysericola]